MGARRAEWIRLAALFLVVVLLDQATKVWITASVPPNAAVPVIEGVFDIVHVQNPGGAFGIFSDGVSDAKRLIFLGGTLIAAVLLIFFFRKLPSEYRVLRAGIILILSGAAGNFIDRLLYGQVVDFLDLHWKGLHWPAFNVADSAVTVGAGIFLFHLVFKKLPA